MIKKQYVKYPRDPLMIDPSTGKTHQSFKDECDINYLIETWLKTGVMPVFGDRQPFYGDVSELPSFADAKNLVAHAEQLFDQLDDEQRELFEGPLEYLEAVQAANEEVGTERPLDVTVPTDTKSLLKGENDGQTLSDE